MTEPKEVLPAEPAPFKGVAGAFAAKAMSVENEDGTKLRTGVVFGSTRAPLGAMWAELSDVEDRLAQRLALLPPGSVVRRGETCWTLRERDGLRELACGTRLDHELGEFCSRFELSLDVADIDEDDLQRQIDITLDVLARVELSQVEQAAGRPSIRP